MMSVDLECEQGGAALAASDCDCVGCAVARARREIPQSYRLAQGEFGGHAAGLGLGPRTKALVESSAACGCGPTERSACGSGSDLASCGCVACATVRALQMVGSVPTLLNDKSDRMVEADPAALSAAGSPPSFPGGTPMQPRVNSRGPASRRYAVAFRRALGKGMSTADLARPMERLSAACSIPDDFLKLAELPAGEVESALASMGGGSGGSGAVPGTSGSGVWPTRPPGPDAGWRGGPGGGTSWSEPPPWSVQDDFDLGAQLGQRPWCDSRRVKSGKIDLFIPDRFTPEDPDEEALIYAWYPFTSAATRAAWRSFADLHLLISERHWEAPKTLGRYPGWRSGWGRNHRYFLYVLQLINTYKKFLPKYWPSNEVVSGWPLDLVCEDMEPGIAEQFEHDEAFFRVGDFDVDGRVCPGSDDRQFQVTEGLGCDLSFQVAPGWPTPAKLPARAAQNSDLGILMCPSYVNGMSLVADDFLYHANRAYWYAFSGRPKFWEAMQYLRQSTLCGRVSLGALMIPARTLVHELIHRAGTGDHCATYHCHAGLSGLWWARTRAYLGVPSVDYDPDGVVDTSFGSGPDRYGSDGFTLYVRFTNSGVAMDESAYEVTSVSFAGCDPPTL